MTPSGSRPFTDEEENAWAGFLAVHSLVIRELDALLGAEHGMPLVEYEVLLKLAIGGSQMRMSELADVAFLSRSGLTRIVDELESLGHVRRERDEQDGRALVATLTPLGRRRLASARRSHRAHVRELFLGHLTDDQRGALAASWRQILDGIDANTGRRPRRRLVGRRRAASLPSR
ncbi:MAG: MarR family winged helix-turn-helix transcriptional regulator [Solirubrobacteraceae bacterium]